MFSGGLNALTMIEPTAKPDAEKELQDFAAANPKMFECVSKQDWWQSPWFRTWLQLAGHNI